MNTPKGPGTGPILTAAVVAAMAGISESELADRVAEAAARMRATTHSAATSVMKMGPDGEYVTAGGPDDPGTSGPTIDLDNQPNFEKPTPRQVLSILERHNPELIAAHPELKVMKAGFFSDTILFVIDLLPGWLWLIIIAANAPWVFPVLGKIIQGAVAGGRFIQGRAREREDEENLLLEAANTRSLDEILEGFTREVEVTDTMQQAVQNTLNNARGDLPAFHTRLARLCRTHLRFRDREEGVSTFENLVRWAYISMRENALNEALGNPTVIDQAAVRAGRMANQAEAEQGQEALPAGMILGAGGLITNERDEFDRIESSARASLEDELDYLADQKNQLKTTHLQSISALGTPTRGGENRITELLNATIVREMSDHPVAEIREARQSAQAMLRVLRMYPGLEDYAGEIMALERQRDALRPTYEQAIAVTEGRLLPAHAGRNPRSQERELAKARGTIAAWEELNDRIDTLAGELDGRPWRRTRTALHRTAGTNPGAAGISRRAFVLGSARGGAAVASTIAAWKTAQGVGKVLDWVWPDPEQVPPEPSEADKIREGSNGRRSKRAKKGARDIYRHRGRKKPQVESQSTVEPDPKEAGKGQGKEKEPENPQTENRNRHNLDDLSTKNAF